MPFSLSVAGPVVSQALSPVLLVLVAISCSLLLVGLSAVLALYVCRRTPPAELKHQMQASGRGGGGGVNGAHGANGNGAEGRMVLIVRSPSGANGPVITSGAVVSPEDADPDIIPSKHGEAKINPRSRMATELHPEKPFLDQSTLPCTKEMSVA